MKLSALMVRLGVLSMVAACAADEPVGMHHAQVGPPSGAVCPTASTLTYDDFAAPFFAHYCTRCHASTLVGGDRRGAPSGHDFDSLAGIMAVADHIDQKAAAGPDAANTSMPPSDPRPTLAERQALGEWIACGMPSS